MRIDMKKGADAYAAAIAIICGGLLLVALGDLIDWCGRMTQRGILSFLGEGFSGAGGFFLTLGGTWLLATLLGSLFSFDTEDLVTAAKLVSIVLSIMLLVLVCFSFLIAWVSPLEHLWLGLGYGLQIFRGTLLFTVSSIFFLYAARMPGEPDETEKFLAEVWFKLGILFAKDRDP